MWKKRWLVLCLLLCCSAETMSYCRNFEAVGSRGQVWLERKLQHQWWKRGSSTAAPVQTQCCDTGKNISLWGVSSAFCWFYVVIRFGSESRDHSMRSCSCQKESIWGIKYGEISHLPHGAVPEKKPQNSSSFYLPFHIFTKTTEDQRQENSF